jgi:hypothetical protein
MENPTNRKDSHRQNAARIFGIPEDQVTDEQRVIGKMDNYHKLYGSNPVTFAEAAINREKHTRNTLHTLLSSMQQDVKDCRICKSYDHCNAHRQFCDGGADFEYVIKKPFYLE